MCPTALGRKEKKLYNVHIVQCRKGTREGHLGKWNPLVMTKAPPLYYWKPKSKELKTHPQLLLRNLVLFRFFHFL